MSISKVCSGNLINVGSFPEQSLYLLWLHLSDILVSASENILIKYIYCWCRLWKQDKNKSERKGDKTFWTKIIWNTWANNKKKMLRIIEKGKERGKMGWRWSRWDKCWAEIKNKSNKNRLEVKCQNCISWQWSFAVCCITVPQESDGY